MEKGGLKPAQSLGCSGWPTYLAVRKGGFFWGGWARGQSQTSQRSRYPGPCVCLAGGRDLEGGRAVPNQQRIWALRCTCLPSGQKVIFLFIHKVSDVISLILDMTRFIWAFF